MKLREALVVGNNRARRTIWAEPNCYLKQLPGTPIAQLWSRRAQEMINELSDKDSPRCETPQILLLFTDDNEDWEPFIGNIDREDREIEDNLSDVFKRRLEELEANQEQN